MSGIAIELPDDALELVAQRVAEILSKGHSPNGEPEPWVGIEEAARHLACRPQRIHDLIHRKSGLPHARDGRRLIFRLSAIDTWVEERS